MERDKGRQRWLSERRHGIGGTDAAAILGYSPWATEYDVWCDKVGCVPGERDMPEAALWGVKLERIVAEHFTEVTGLRWWNPERIYYDAQTPVLRGTPDRLIIGQSVGLEVKTTSLRMADHWGPTGTDHIPAQYVVQCVHYMLVTGMTEWRVAVLIGGQEFRHYTLRRDDEVCEWMRTRLMAWWQRHVVDGEQPPIEGKRSTHELLARMFPVDGAQPMDATPDGDTILAAVALAREAFNAAAVEKLRTENVCKAYIGEASGLVGSNGDRATWRTSRDREVTDWRAVAQKLAPSDALIEKYTTTKQGARPFLYVAPSEVTAGKGST